MIKSLKAGNHSGPVGAAVRQPSLDLSAWREVGSESPPTHPARRQGRSHRPREQEAREQEARELAARARGQDAHNSGPGG